MKALYQAVEALLEDARSKALEAQDWSAVVHYDELIANIIEEAKE